jgi:antitoxin MazE
MKVKIAKWGNSLAVRLPKAYASDLGLTNGSEVELERKGKQLALRPVVPPEIPQYRLEDLLAQIKPGQKPPPFEDWGIVEKEWPAEDWSDIAPSDEEWEAWKKESEAKGAGPQRR